MNKYHFIFVGCKKGAIGIQSRFTATSTGATSDEALVKLYDTYDHIRLVSTPVVVN